MTTPTIGCVVRYTPSKWLKWNIFSDFFRIYNKFSYLCDNIGVMR